jgi:hypothetical protein
MSFPARPAGLPRRLVSTADQLAVEEFRKICYPQNIEVYEIREMSFQEHRIREDLES